MADNAGLLVEGKDSSFQNQVHLAMAAKGFDDERTSRRTNETLTTDISWDSNAASSACRMSASRRSSMR